MQYIRFLKKDNIILIALLFCGMNFQAKFFYFAFALFILQCFTKRNLHYDKITLIYLLFAVGYAIYGAITAGLIEAIRRLAFLCMYIVGYDSTISHSTSYEENVMELWIRKCIIAFSVGAFFHYFFNMIINWGFVKGRNTLDIWSDGIISATGQAALVAPMVGIAVACIIVPLKGRRRVFSICALVIIILYDLMLAGRTLLVLILLDALLCILLYSVYERNRINKIKMWAIIIAIILSAFALYQLNIFGIKSLFEESNLYARFFDNSSVNGLLDDSRMERKWYYLAHMFDYLLGGQHMNATVGYAHDLLLDCYDEAGVLIIIPLLIIVVSSIKNLISVIRYGCLSRPSIVFLLSFYFCVYIQFFMEPILVGTRWLFAGFCLVNGCVNAILKMEKENKIYLYGLLV